MMCRVQSKKGKKIGIKEKIKKEATNFFTKLYEKFYYLD